MSIHHTAVISPEANIAPGVEIGPYTVVEADVNIGKNTIIGPHAIIESHTDIGEGCRIYQFCSIGGAPQDLKYRREETRVVIGNFNTIREFVTIHRATGSGNVTSLGDNNLIMAYCHIAHNCAIGNQVIMANSANLAGHITIEDYATIGGLSGILQFTRIGAYAFIAGASAVTRDVPPFVVASGNHARLYGLNLVGLKRRGFKPDTIQALKDAYRIIFRSSLLLKAALEKVREEVPDLAEVRQFTGFIEKATRGICR